MLRLSRYAIRDFIFVYGDANVTTDTGGGQRSAPPLAESGAPALTYLELHELNDGARLHLQLTGELDLGSAPTLSQRLEELRTERRGVRLDLSRLAFMDSTGLHLLIGAFDHARAFGWDLELDPRLSPQVERLFELTNMCDLVGAPAMNGQ